MNETFDFHPFIGSRRNYVVVVREIMASSWCYVVRKQHLARKSLVPSKTGTKSSSLSPDFCSSHNHLSLTNCHGVNQSPQEINKMIHLLYRMACLMFPFVSLLFMLSYLASKPSLIYFETLCISLSIRCRHRYWNGYNERYILGSRVGTSK